MADFCPSQVTLEPPIPFLGTFGRAETEAAIAWIVRVAQLRRGDDWRPVDPREVSFYIKPLIDAYYEKNLPRNEFWLANPFYVPNFDDAIRDGWLVWVGDEAEGRKRPLQITDAALARIRERGWVKEKTDG